MYFDTYTQKCIKIFVIVYIMYILYVYFIYINILTMLYSNGSDSRFVSFEMEGVKINFVNKDQTLWFTKKELSKIFGVSKKMIKSALEDISYEEIMVDNKTKKIYKLNSVIMLGYRLNKYKQTKVLNLLNMYVKVKPLSSPLLSRVKTSISSNVKVLSNIVSV